VLSGLESSDHSGRPEMLPIRRQYLLTGSCLVHKGALACSHLSTQQQRGVALFCHAYRLLELTASESVSQIIIWKEVLMQWIRVPWNRFLEGRVSIIIGYWRVLLSVLICSRQLVWLHCVSAIHWYEWYLDRVYILTSCFFHEAISSLLFR
jgi:hypothetical protein